MVATGGVTETVTIINNSGKLISTGKHIFGIFEKARTSYSEKKAELRAERAARKAHAESGRAHTFDIPPKAHTFDLPPRAHTFEIRASSTASSTVSDDRRRSQDDSSRVSSRSHRSHRSERSDRSDRSDRSERTIRPGHRSTNRSMSYSHASRAEADDRSRRPSVARSGSLTAANLMALGARTESPPSSTPSSPSDAQGPSPPSYEESVRDRPSAARSASEPQFRPVQFQPDQKGEISQTIPEASVAPSTVASTAPTAPTMTPTATSAPKKKKKKRTPTQTPPPVNIDTDSDDDLAYGYVPPNLATRTDLDPKPRSMPPLRSNSAPVMASGLPADASASSASSESETDDSSDGDSDDSEELPPEVSEVKALAERIEDLLDEAHCIHHSATAIISHLQGQPEAAAAVALTLAELSAVLAKMSPTILGTLKGAAPAVFALLASPQFLVAAGMAVGVTVVMFGGWKIVKQITAGVQPMAMEVPVPGRVLGEVPDVPALPAPEEPPVFSIPASQPAVSVAAPVVAPAPAPVAAAPTPVAPVVAPVVPPVAAPAPVATPTTPEIPAAVQKQLSSIERWCRGIVDATAADKVEAARIDDELLSPEAREAVRAGGACSEPTRNSPEPLYSVPNDQIGPDDSVSMISGTTNQTAHTSHSHRTHKSHKSHRSERSEKSTRSWSTWRTASVASSRTSEGARRYSESEWWEGSVAGTERSGRTHRTSRTKGTKTHRKERHHHKEKELGIIQEGGEEREERRVRREKEKEKEKEKEERRDKDRRRERDDKREDKREDRKEDKREDKREDKKERAREEDKREEKKEKKKENVFKNMFKRKKEGEVKAVMV